MEGATGGARVGSRAAPSNSCRKTCILRRSPRTRTKQARNRRPIQPAKAITVREMMTMMTTVETDGRKWMEEGRSCAAVSRCRRASPEGARMAWRCLTTARSRDSTSNTSVLRLRKSFRSPTEREESSNFSIWRQEGGACDGRISIAPNFDVPVTCSFEKRRSELGDSAKFVR